MIVTRDTGIIVVCGELIRSDFYIDQNSSMRATYYIKTQGTDWNDPTGGKGATARSMKVTTMRWVNLASWVLGQRCFFRSAKPDLVGGE